MRSWPRSRRCAQLPKAAALDEIEARLGPPAGATWELQTVVPALKDEMASFAVSFPSGTDETVMFQMAGDKIQNLRILAEPSDVAPIFPVEASAAPVAEKSPLPLGLGLAGVALSLLAAFTPRMRHAHAHPRHRRGRRRRRISASA